MTVYTDLTATEAQLRAYDGKDVVGTKDFETVPNLLGDGSTNAGNTRSSMGSSYDALNK